MAKYVVRVKEQEEFEYTLEAENKEDARDRYYEGDVMPMDLTADIEILSVKELK